VIIFQIADAETVTITGIWGILQSATLSLHTGMQTADENSAHDFVIQMEPIAVVGLAFKFPQDVVTEGALWRLLMEKRCTTTEWPQDRINIDSYHSTSRDEISSVSLQGMNKKTNAEKVQIIARGGHFLAEDPAAFDASFFSIAPAEATALDPQQRLALETTYAALENGEQQHDSLIPHGLRFTAGICLEEVRQSRTGVYMGSMCHDWNSLLDKDIESTPKYAATGIADSMLSNRVSWFFDLAGPSITVNTACSSSLLALHLACQSLRAAEIDMVGLDPLGDFQIRLIPLHNRLL
jgi:acyl transferase domain-containing protein